MTTTEVQTATQASKLFKLNDPTKTTKEIARHIGATVSETHIHGHHPSIFKAPSGIVGIRLTDDKVLIFEPFQVWQRKMAEIATQIDQ